MLKSLFLAACIIGTAYTAAAVDDYLHIKTANGWVVFNLNNADRITFNNGKMTVLDQSGNTLGSINQSCSHVAYIIYIWVYMGVFVPV